MKEYQKMKRPVIASRRQAMSAVIGAYPGGRECAAARLGYELKKFDNHLYESAGSRPLSDEQIHRLEQDAGTTFLPEYVAAMYGGMFVSLAEPESVDHQDLYERSVKTSASRGVVDQFIAKALEVGVVSATEASVILAAHRKHMSARHAEVLATLQLHRRAP
jgi:hypothetical protein